LKTLVADAVRRPLETEYEQRARQVQAVVSREIEAAVRGPIASQMEQMLNKALTAQREELRCMPQQLSDDAIQKIAASIGLHPQLLSAIDSLSATLSERWTEVARNATATAQREINGRIAASEQLAGQVIRDVQQKLNSLSAEMDRTIGSRRTNSPSGGTTAQEEDPDRDKEFAELMQSTGTQFERELKATLEKVFSKS
jgi:hypothetical protein